MARRLHATANLGRVAGCAAEQLFHRCKIFGEHVAPLVAATSLYQAREVDRCLGDALAERGPVLSTEVIGRGVHTGR